MKEKTKRALILAFSAFLALAPACAYAMHIAEGYLPLGWCVAWYAIYAPFFFWGIASVKKKASGSSQLKMLLAMSGAFCFVLSALKIPSVTGSSSHPTGVGLGVSLFGPASMAIIGFVVLLFQAILLAHGGLTTLGANAFSMAVAGPFAGYAAYAAAKALKAPKWLCIFLSAFTADLFTYVVTSFELAMAFNSAEMPFFASFTKFLLIFAVTQVPLAAVEGIVTVMAFSAIESLCKEEVGILAKAGGF